MYCSCFWSEPDYFKLQFTALAAVILNSLKYKESVKHHIAMLQQWTPMNKQQIL